MPDRRTIVLVHASCAAAALALPVDAGENPFSPRAGWPQTHSGSSVDGGMLVNLDDDPELELVQVAGTAGVGCQVHAFNIDGTPVPGWPTFIADGSFSAPAFGDIDGDGDGEVVVHDFFYGIRGSVWAFHHDGVAVAGFPRDVGGTLKAPALADVDGDGDLDIISVGNFSGIGHVSVLDDDGAALPGWPRSLDDLTGTGAAAGDLDGDGAVEIVVGSFYRMHAFDATGEPLPGFPFEPGDEHTFNYTSPTLADLDGDGDREIISATSRETCCAGRVYVLHHDGTRLDGWPLATGYAIFAPPTVVDLDGDGSLDIVVGDTVLAADPLDMINAWTWNAFDLPGFPAGPFNAIHAQIMAADIDGDGALELMYDDNTAASGLQAINHDGTPVAGWPLAVAGSSFQQSPNIADVDHDGFTDIFNSGNLIAAGNVSIHGWTSTVPYASELAPVPTYQYTVRRNGVVPGQGPACPADLDGSGSVAVGDLLIVLAAWGENNEGDVTGDGVTNVDDLLAVLAAWGACAE